MMIMVVVEVVVVVVVEGRKSGDKTTNLVW